MKVNKNNFIWKSVITKIFLMLFMYKSACSNVAGYTQVITSTFKSLLIIVIYA